MAISTTGSNIQDLQERILKENLTKYGEANEKAVKLAMNALNKGKKEFSNTGEKYFSMLTQTVEASEKATGKQLAMSNQRISAIKDAITNASDLNEKERALLQEQVAVVQQTFKENATNTSSLLNKVDKFLDDSAVDITSVVAGLTSNNPAIMFAVKWIGDRMKAAKEEKQEMERKLAEASQVNMDGYEGPAGATQDPVAEKVDTTNELLAANLKTNEDWKADDQANAFREEEERREGARAREDQIEALEAIANKDFNSNVEVEGGDSGGFFSDLLGGLFGGAGGIKGALGGLATKFGPMLARALPIGAIAAGTGMILKDGWDMASAAFDDNIATEIEGQDIGGTVGGAIGGAVGAVFGGPIGAGIGMMVGNFVGGAIGEFLDPNRDEMLRASSNQINDRLGALQTSMGILDDQLANGVISQEQYNAARAEIQREIDDANALSLERDQVSELQTARDRAAMQYNQLNEQINLMEEAGISVPQAMYDQLEAAENNFDTARDAFELAADELDSKVDPSWWDSLTSSVSNAVASVNASVQGAFQSVRNSLTNLAIPDIEGMSEDERAALQAKVNALPEGLESAAGLTQEQLVLLAEDLNMSPEDLAAMDSAAVLRATAMDSIGDGIQGIADGASNAVDTLGNTIWSGAEALGIDDNITAAADAVRNAITEATDGAKAYWEGFKNRMSNMKDSVLGFFGLGGDEEDTSIEDQIAARELQIAEAEDRVQRSIDGENVYFGRDSVGREEDAEEILRLQSEINQLREASSTASGVEVAGASDDDTEMLQEELNDIQERIDSLPNTLAGRSQRRRLQRRGAQIQNELTRRQLDAQGLTPGVDANGVSTLVPTERNTGQQLNATQMENRDMTADSQAGGNVTSTVAVNQTNNAHTTQRITPVIPVRNAQDDFRSSGVAMGW